MHARDIADPHVGVLRESARRSNEMDDETKLRLEDVDRRTVALDKKIDDQGKRFDDVKWFGGSVTLLFSVLLLVAGLNFNTERSSLETFKKTIEDRVSKTDETQLQLYGVNGEDLSGQDVSAEFFVDQSDGKPGQKPSVRLRFYVVVKNVAENISGPIFLKLYTHKDLKLNLQSSDETRYAYEDYWAPGDLTPNSIPGKMSIVHDLSLVLPDPANVKPGKHQSLLKLYYGKGKVVSASVYFTTAVSAPILP